MRIPESIREDVRIKLWSEADRLDWPTLTLPAKSRYYTIWTETPDLGGRLGAFMDARQVRVYIKDTLLKAYTRERTSDASRVLRVLGLPGNIDFSTTYIKPHGRRLTDGREIAWSRATEWKATLLALHERAFEGNATAFGAVLFEANARHSSPESRAVVESAAKKLEIQKLVWLE
ncbi:hypothetical protein [Phreatobacter sp. AB_2022a]|uniref:hypothetical protein n=1 Tax=Phreatobacter sp. AB_2022a TaxID=3003134 RepID=UPI002286FBB6|nr:hypothetical protein [Phreatobacter sp. AB_2022a]MCZ0735676.1 hypothetical protein [Phreatobacter sp. AB_2022a]